MNGENRLMWWRQTVTWWMVLGRVLSVHPLELEEEMLRSLVNVCPGMWGTSGASLTVSSLLSSLRAVGQVWLKELGTAMASMFIVSHGLCVGDMVLSMTIWEIVRPLKMRPVGGGLAFGEHFPWKRLRLFWWDDSYFLQKWVVILKKKNKKTKKTWSWPLSCFLASCLSMWPVPLISPAVMMTSTRMWHSWGTLTRGWTIGATCSGTFSLQTIS
jgi:hypothetical protein